MVGQCATPLDEATRSRIAELEREVFDARLPVGEVDRLLARLREEGSRAEARARLIEEGQGHQERIIHFARTCADLEGRQACAEVVEALDAKYRTTALGKRLCSLYGEHAEAFLPSYWATFRANSLDPRAVAMLMSADPEGVCTWLKAHGDGHDVLRFILLRIRESAGDSFAAEHLHEYTSSGIRLVLPHLYPVLIDNPFNSTTFRGRRIVGHVLLDVLSLKAKGKKGAMPQIDEFRTWRRWVVFFRSDRCLILPEEGYWYQKRGLKPLEPGRTRIDYVRCGEGVIPEFWLTLDHWGEVRRGRGQLPAWAMALVPRAYQGRFALCPSDPKLAAPKLVRSIAATRSASEEAVLGPRNVVTSPTSADASGPALVVLPPRVSAKAKSSTQAAAELACDRLAQELAATGVVRVLDRKQIDRVLEERQLAGTTSEPVLSYDAMLRMDVQSDRLDPRAEVGVIETSTGSLVGQVSVGWPIREEDLGGIVSACQDAIGRVVHGRKDRLKVRYLGGGGIEPPVRLRPMAARLDQAFSGALRASSDRIVLVQHLEAGSSKEESLLLLLGMSRLAGKRTFVPEAHVLIEWRLSESDSLGKVFEETPIELAVRARRSGQPAGEWQRVLGKVKEFDSLIDKGWKALSESLSEARPDGAAEFLSGMARRREQAKTEIEVARSLAPKYSAIKHHVFNLRSYCRRSHYRRGEGGVQQDSEAVAHAAAAVKLDPTSEEAAFEYIMALVGQHTGNSRYERGGVSESVTRRLLTEILRYARHFDGDTDHLREVYSAALLPTYLPPLGFLMEEKTAGQASGALGDLAALKEIAEKCVSGDDDAIIEQYEDMVAVVHRGMRAAGVSAEERWRWIEGILSAYDAQLAKAPMTRDHTVPLFTKLFIGYRLRAMAAELAIEEGRVGSAGEFAWDVVSRWCSEAPELSVSDRASWLERTFGLAIGLDDAGLLAKLHGVTAPKVDDAVGLMKIEWPRFVLWKEEAPDRRRRERPRVVQGLSIRATMSASAPSTCVIKALVGDGDRLYILMTPGGLDTRRVHAEDWAATAVPSEVGYLTLDGNGRPVGKPVALARSDGPALEVWDGIATLPPLGLGKQPSICCAQAASGRLYLGSMTCGLLVYDLDARSWKQYGPAQGLPSPCVSNLAPTGADTVWCAVEGGHCSVNVRTGQVQLISDWFHHGRESLPSWTGREWLGGKDKIPWYQQKLYADLIYFIGFRQTISNETAYGWPMSKYPQWSTAGQASVGSRRYCLCQDGLFELSSNNRIVRSWWPTFGLQPADSFCRVAVPANCPLEHDYVQLAGTDSLAVLNDGSSGAGARRILALEPATETWFGPIDVEGGRHAIGTQAGVWLGDDNSELRFLGNDDIKSAARAAGRVTTTEGYARSRDAFVASLPEIDQAKFLYGMRRFDDAKRLLEAVLRREPESAEALLFLGELHDRRALNQPEVAVRYYKQLAARDDDPSVALTGMFMLAGCLRDQGKWQEAYDMSEAILRRFERIQGNTYCAGTAMYELTRLRSDHQSRLARSRRRER
ncbi:MAG: tetratricopeptide repeat protein [Phycisphaerae bacterium]|nr:tetratricopeptide repeat protein [Phycisphaerae bacterium]